MLHITCNMCTRDLPDMYALSPRACGPQASGIHIRQIPRAHVTTITYCILRGRIKGFNSAIYAIKCQQVVIELWLGSYSTVVG